MTTPAALAQREWLSRYTAGSLALVVHKAGVRDQADGDVVTATMTSVPEDIDPPQVPVEVFADRAATYQGDGVYTVDLQSTDTATPGLYAIEWSYALDTVPQVYGGYIEVGEAAPEYDALPPEYKVVVENVWGKFADIYDSPLGGPHLQVYIQGGFGRNRMAQLLRSALGKLNVVAQPHTTYGDGPEIDGRAIFPLGSHSTLLETGLVIEVIKHLRRSYVEQPQIQGISTARTDRRDYLQRWGDILRDEEREYKGMLDGFKIAHMGLGRPQVAVAGGMYIRHRLVSANIRGQLVAKGLWRVYHP